MGISHLPQSSLLDARAHASAIAEQLERILASSLFRNTKRSSLLLEYVVSETLQGRSEGLKERTIGVTVFARKPTYDTGEDPIVRSSAADVRKRLAQYYYEAGRESEIRIELTSGSYIPHFWLASSGTAEAETASESPQRSDKEPRRFFRLNRPTSIAAVLLVAFGLVWLFAKLSEARSPTKLFWRPLLEGNTVTLAMGDLSDTSQVAGQPDTEIGFAQTSLNDKVGFVDGMAVARVAALLGGAGKRTEIRRAGSVSLRDLRRGPAVLVGEMNNPWAKLVENDLRFRFVWDQIGKSVVLRDGEHPDRPLWQISFNAKYADLKEDRAIVTRIVDRRTENSLLILAGCGRDGTTAAAEFVTQPEYLERFAERAPKGWERRNLQVVIATDLIKGNSGPPRIIAIHFW